jgi:hypothetical protein
MTQEHALSSTGTTSAALAELDRQVARLHDLGYPRLAGIDPDQLDALVEPLRYRLPDVSTPDDRIPFLLVVRSGLVSTVEQVARWTVKGKAGWTDMVDELAGFAPIEGVDVPDSPVYLLLDVDTGAETLGIPPNDALPKIGAAGRTPLTIDEGVALVTQHPDVFSTRNAFQALGSRAANKRVPSFWVSKGAPRLGWCWAGNPHTWLGAASAAGRT